METDKNADRFKGFADIYDFARPACPKAVLDILIRYLGRAPQTVVDIGCGTGLSTRAWKNAAGRVIGVEPSDDMRAAAVKASAGACNVEFIKAFSQKVPLPDLTADIVTCSQSFHWMEPFATISEAFRLLKSGGVFAVYDYDWPPVSCVSLEKAYNAFADAVHKAESEGAPYFDAAVRHPKDRHLENIKSFGRFSYVREVVFMGSEAFDAKRYLAMAASQGGLQAILNRRPQLVQDALNRFKAGVSAAMGEQTAEMGICYRMRIGIK